LDKTPLAAVGAAASSHLVHLFSFTSALFLLPLLALPAGQLFQDLLVPASSKKKFSLSRNFGGGFFFLLAQDSQVILFRRQKSSLQGP
jgi:hypothetical protein